MTGAVYSIAKLLDEEGSLNRDLESRTRYGKKSGQELCMREFSKITVYAYGELGSF